MTPKERIATLLTALEEALDMADILLEIVEKAQVLTPLGCQDTKDTLSHLRGFAASERDRLNAEREEGES